MEKLDFNPVKSGNDFRENYKLHDLAEFAGKNLLTQWNISFENFGDDRRNDSVWEKGNDKPDLIISFNNKSALLDWKGKHAPKWIVNSRAVKAYELWQMEKNLPVIICFFLFDDLSNLLDRRFAVLNSHKYKNQTKLQWDKNKTIEFVDDLPIFNKTNLINFVFDRKEKDQ